MTASRARVSHTGDQEPEIIGYVVLEYGGVTKQPRVAVQGAIFTEADNAGAYARQYATRAREFGKREEYVVAEVRR